MVLKKFAFIATLVAVGFLSGTYFVEDDLGQSFCLGAFSTGLMGAIVLLIYTKLSHLAETVETHTRARGLEAPEILVDDFPAAAAALRFSNFRTIVENPAESKALNSLAMVTVVVAIGFLTGTHVVENDIGQSFCLGAFATGLAGSILLLCYTRIARVSERRRIERAISASEARFRTWVEHANDMITVLSADGMIRFETPSVRRILGYEPREIVGERLFDRVHPDDVAELKRSFEYVAANPGQVVTNQYRFQHKNGSWRTLESVGKCVSTDDGKEIVSDARDITDRQEIEDALRASKERFQDFAETAAEYFWETDACLCFTYVSERFQEKTGLVPEAVLGRHRSEVFASNLEDLSQWEAHIEVLDKRLAYSDFEIKQLYPDGTMKVFLESGKPVFEGDNRFVGYRGIGRDVTLSHILSQRLSYQASHDMLTGLINRQYFDERLQRVIDSARNEQSEHVLCYLDLDQFKVINDTCGHVAGDGLLRQLATILKDKVRSRDSIARLGGDEFGVLMEHCSLEQGERVAKMLHEAVEAFRFSWEEAEFKIGVSIGLVPINESSVAVTEVLSAADAACYIAKDRGRNRIHIYRDDDADVAKRHGEMQWVTRINRALDEGQLLLYYQPIVPLTEHHSVASGPGERFEVLLRLRDGEDGVVTASEFLPAAERYSLSARIDQWVVKSVLEWLQEHSEQLDRLHSCSINLSGHSLADEVFPDFVVDQLQTSKVPAEKICFEVTETAAIANLSAATRFMARLKSMGCKFALDDFGSGLSSFAYLKTLPVDYLKIDGFFVKNVASNPIDHAMVKSIHEIARVMGKQTIAEYADDESVLEALRDIGVDYAQGYGVREPHPLPR